MDADGDEALVSYIGAFVENPTTPNPFALAVLSRTLSPGREEGLVPTVPEHFDGAVFQILRLGDDGNEICGSGYFVAPGLGLTATHVFDGVEKGDRFRALSPRNDGSLQQWTIEQLRRGIVRRDDVLTGAGEVRQHDVALFSLKPQFDLPPLLAQNIISLEVEEPRVGDLLTVVGFRAPLVEVTGHREARSEFQFLSSVGRILDVFPAGRGWNFPAPMLIADLETLGGMSGGPVFNRNGRAIGVLTGSLGDANGGRPSYVTLSWSAMTLEVDASWPSNWPHGKGSLRFAAMNGMAAVHGLEYRGAVDATAIVIPQRAE